MKLVLSRRADGDVADIAAYTIEQWGMAQAERYVGGLGRFLAGLAERGEVGLASYGLPDEIPVALRLLRAA